MTAVLHGPYSRAALYVDNSGWLCSRIVLTLSLVRFLVRFGTDAGYTVFAYKNTVFEAIGINDLAADDKGQALDLNFLFLVGVFTFVDAHTELHVTFSAPAHFRFTNAEYGVVVVFFCKQLPELGKKFRSYGDFQHGLCLFRV